MSIRANSLQSVFVDSIYYAAFTGLAALTLTTVVRGDEPRVVVGSAFASHDRLVDDQVDSQLNTDDKLPSGNPEESAEGKREAMMLGMKLYEQHSGYIRVDDVAATSPAWDAGIRPGDRLISIDGLEPRKLASWVEDLGKVLHETPDGKSVAAEVERDGDQLALRVRLPVSNAAAVRDARQEEQAIAKMQGGRQQQMPLNRQGSQPIVSSSETGHEGYDPRYGGYGLGGYGLGGFFVDDGSGTNGNTNSASSPNDDRLANNAIARLMAVNMVAGGNNRQTGQLNNMQSSGGQVGLAAFQNTERGVHVVVAVRGLPQGTYRVGIGEGDAFGAGLGGDAVGTGGVGFDAGRFGNEAASDRRVGAGNRSFNDSRQQMNTRQQNQQNQMPSNPRLQNQRPGVQATPGGTQQAPLPTGAVPGGGQPGASGSESGAGGGSPIAPHASLANPHDSAILAQQLDSRQMQGSQHDNPGVAPGTFQDDSGLAPGTFPNNQNQNAGGNATNNNQSRNGNNIINQPNPNSDVRPTSMGVLRVGADGSGRLDNVLEGVQVRNLAGMNVTIYSDMAQGGGMNGTNQQASAAANRQMQPNQRFPQNNAGANRNAQNMNGQLRGNQVQSGLNGAGNQGIVATGMIQIMEGNFPGNGQNQTGNSTGTNRSTGQVPQQQGTGQQGAGSQLSNPQEDFDPSR